MTPSSTAVGHEGEFLPLLMKANANPMTMQYTWLKDGEPLILNDRVIADGGVLNITKLSRSDDGIYTCRAVNSQGSATINITVIVECEYTGFSSMHISILLPYK